MHYYPAGTGCSNVEWCYLPDINHYLSIVETNNIDVVNIPLILRETLNRDLTGGSVIQLLYRLMIDSM